MRNCILRQCQDTPTKSGGLTAFMHGRHGKERRDSVTCEILEDRRMHHVRLLAGVQKLDLDLVKYLWKLGLGGKRRRHRVYASHETGAAGAATHLASTATGHPAFTHILPEIGFAGHSNSGKSTLVNAMAGIGPTSKLASVSDRAGWTDLISFYMLGKKPPVLILADMPGYGHAVASTEAKRAWKLMIKNYVQNRVVLCRCCVLVDCTRGLCEEDVQLLKFLQKCHVDWILVLTKADLLSTELLASCLTAVREDLVQLRLISDSEEPKQFLSSKIKAVSAATGAGVQMLWLDMVAAARKSSSSSSSSSDTVREHVRAFELRLNRSTRFPSSST